MFYIFKHLIKNALPFCALIVFFDLSCTYEKIALHDYPEETQPYIDLFFKEAASRNLTIQPDDHDIVIQFDELQNASGTCGLSSHKIRIDSNYWRVSSASQREFLISHELGHCILDRLHRNEKTKQCECVSMMRGAENGFDCIVNFDSPSWKKHYYDELFNTGSTNPSWYEEAQQNDFSQRVLVAAIDTVRASDSAFVVDLHGFNTDLNYEISLKCSNWGSGSGQGVTIYFAEPQYRFNRYLSTIDIFKDPFSGLIFRTQNKSPFDSDTTNIVLRRINNFEYLYINDLLIHGFDLLPKPSMQFKVLYSRKNLKIKCEIYYLLK